MIAVVVQRGLAVTRSLCPTWQPQQRTAEGRRPSASPQSLDRRGRTTQVPRTASIRRCTTNPVESTRKWIKRIGRVADVAAARLVGNTPKKLNIDTRPTTGNTPATRVSPTDPVLIEDAPTVGRMSSSACVMEGIPCQTAPHPPIHSNCSAILASQVR